MPFFFSGEMIVDVSPIILLDSWLERIWYFEKRFQSEVLCWTLGGPEAGSFAGGINPEEN
jgi:hypothetical protein